MTPLRAYRDRTPISDYEIVCRVEIERFWEKKRNQQRRQNLCKALIVSAGIWILVIWAIIWLRG